jgi:signal transduction histidine kinase
MNTARGLLLLAIIAALAIVGAGYGAKFGWWDYRAGFAILRWATYAGLAVAAVALVALFVRRVRAGHVLALAAAVVVAAGAAAVPMSWLHFARSVPPINDITTDTDNPPAFVAILPLRAGAPVSARYPGAATADAQRAGYPDLHPFATSRPPREAFALALAAARTMAWQIIASDEAAGRIEATATTPWFGFTDDVVIRVASEGTGSRIDVRSVSRVGRSDLGANARRIRDYLAALNR